MYVCISQRPDGVNKSPKQNPVLAFLNCRKYSYLKIFQNPTQFSFSNRVTVFNVILYMFHSLQPVFLYYNHTSSELFLIFYQPI